MVRHVVSNHLAARRCIPGGGDVPIRNLDRTSNMQRQPRGCALSYRWLLSVILVLGVTDLNALSPPRPRLFRSVDVGPGKMLILSVGYTPYLSRDDGANWAPLDPPFAWKVAGVGASESRVAEPLAGGRDADVLAWWMPAFGPVTASAGKDVHYSCAGDAVYETIDRGMHWSRVGLLTPPSSVDSQVLPGCSSILAMPKDVLYVGGYGVYRSIDAGRTWAPLRVDKILAHATVDFIAADDGGTLYVNARTLALPGGKASYRSTDGGERWQRIQFGRASFDDRRVPSLVGVAVGKLYASSYEGLLASVDGGKSWASAGAGITMQSKEEGIPFDVVVEVKASPRGIYATTARQVYKFDGAAQIWVPLGKKGIPRF